METETSSISQPIASSTKNEIKEICPVVPNKEDQIKEEKCSTVNVKVFPKELNSKLIPEEKNSSKHNKKSKNSSRNNDGIEVVSEYFSENMSQNPDIVIEIDEDKEITPTKYKSIQKITNKKNKKKSKTEKSQFINGYNPFIFYEKEKFKDVNFKEVNAREYIKKISAEWKKMSEEEKEPYVKLAIDFKNNLSQNPELKMLINRKRKRNIEDKKGTDIIGKKRKSGVKSERKKCLSVSSNNQEIVNISVSKKRNKSELKKDKRVVAKNNSIEDVKEYFNSVLVPFVEKSYEFFRRQGIIKSKC